MDALPPFVVLGGLVALSAICALWAILMPQPETIPFPGGPSSISKISGKPHVPLASILVAIGRMSPKFGSRAKELEIQLIHAGSGFTFEMLHGMKIMCALGGALAFGIIAPEFKLMNPGFFAVAMLIGYVAPDFWLKQKLGKRYKRIVIMLPEVIDLLSLCVGAGLDFVLAMNRVVAIPQYRHEPLIEELSAALQEMKLGKRRSDALKTMAKRVNLPELSSFVRTIVQADRMGTPIAQVLAVHAEDVRGQRFLRAEREALKAPLKILVPLIFCIMPCVAIIVGAPVFLQFLQQNPFANQ